MVHVGEYISYMDPMGLVVMREEMAEGKVYRWPGAQPKIPTEAQMMEGQKLGSTETNGWAPKTSQDL